MNRKSFWRMVLVCAAACVAAESFLCMDVHAQESDFEAMLKDNILTLSPGPSGNAIPVMNGLYFIYISGGQPLEFDESVFKDRKHFDPEVYKFSKPQMQYDLHEGLHFKANNLP